MGSRREDGAPRRLDGPLPLRISVREELERLISNGTFRPGTRLVETELADTLGVSRGPIREALQHLAKDGFVDLRPRLGAYVHVPAPKEVKDFYDVRRVLEGESAALAAERVTPAGALRIRRVLEHGRTYLERGVDPSGAPRKVSFHQEVTIVADNAMLAQMLAALGKRSTWYLSDFELGRRRQTWQEHELIGQAILDGDPIAARKATEAHIESARAHYNMLRAERSEGEASA